MGTILYISDGATNNNSILKALEILGYGVVSTFSPTQAVSLLFLMQSVAGIVLSGRAKEHAGFDVEHALHTICPSVPIILSCDSPQESAPSTGTCLRSGEPLEKLVDKVRRLLSGYQVTSGRCHSEVRAA